MVILLLPPVSLCSGILTLLWGHLGGHSTGAQITGATTAISTTVIVCVDARMAPNGLETPPVPAAPETQHVQTCGTWYPNTQVIHWTLVL